MTAPTQVRRRHYARQILLDTIRDKQGEWTTGRVKALYRKTVPTHMLRAVIRRHLRELHAAGHLELHDEGARRYYTWRAPVCGQCGGIDGPFKGTENDLLCLGCIHAGGAW